MDVGARIKQEHEAWYRMPGTEVRLRIRRPKPIRLREIRGHAERRKGFGRRAETVVDDDALTMLLLDECVLEWSGVERDGKPLTCTPENRRLLHDHWMDFCAFWQEIAFGLVDEDAARLEDNRKNLPGGGSSTSPPTTNTGSAIAKPASPGRR